MKLLSPFQAKDKQQEDLARKLIRIQEVQELATMTNAKLARAEADFNDSLARNRYIWATEEEKHQVVIKDMTAEIEALEKRKEQALIPIKIYKQEADKMIEEAQEILLKAKEREQQAEYLQEKLETKLTEVEDRESVLIDGENRLKIAKQGLETQQEHTKEGVKRLSEEMIMFHEKQRLEEESLAKRKSELALAEINFNAKLEKYQRDLEALKEWDRQLKDERQTLDREYKRAK